jgi:uncharacterized protein (TIGR03437 family)
MRPLARLLLFSIAPVGLYAHITGFPLGYTGVPSTLASDNGGATCAQCHSGLQVVSGGTSFTLHISSYTPGVQQGISLTMSNTPGLRFAFQLTARLQSDLTKAAGTFTKTSNSQPYCANGSTFSCNGDIQYVTNTATAVFPTTGSGITWGLTWTPPGRDLGPVVFYAVAVAANNDGTPLNDRVYVISGQSTSAAPCNLSGTPQFNPGNRAVLDSAAFRPTIASKGLIVILGSNLFQPGSQAGGYLLNKNDLDNGQWPTALGCVAVQVSGPNLPKTRLPIYYVSEGLIKAQAPTIPAHEVVDMQVILNPDPIKPALPTFSAVYQVQADTVAPSLFTFNSQGTGNAAAVDVTKGKLLADTSVIPTAVSAAPGDIISLYGTGFGDTNPLYAAGQFAALPPATLPRLTTTPVSVTIGGVAVPSSDIKYAGLAFDAPGFYVINVRVPQVPDGDQAVSIVVGNTGTQGSVNIPVKNP